MSLSDYGPKHYFLAFERNFNPGEGKIAYTLQVVFEGAGNQTATLNSIDFMGGSYTVCQTIQFNYKPSANMAIVVVEPQVTDVAVPTKTPEEIQQEVEENGQVLTEPVFSWLPPWFWLRTTTRYQEFDTTLITCASLLYGWLEDGQGLENPLYGIFEGVPQEQIESLLSIAISTITTATASFIGGYIASKLLEWNPLAYAIAMGGYFAAASIALLYVFTLVDACTAKATLITVGWTLLSLSTLGFAATIPIYMSNIVGSDPVTAAVRSLAKAIINVSVITPLLKTLGASIGGFLFYLFNFVLGILALTLGYQIVL